MEALPELEAEIKLERKEVLFLVCATITSVGGSAAVLALAVVAARAGEGMSQSGLATGVMLATLFISASISLPYTSRVVERFGTLRSFAFIQIFAAVVFAAEALAIAYGAPAYPVIIVGTIFSGACTGWTMVLNQLVLQSYCLPGHETAAVARLSTSSGAATAIGAPLAGLLIDAAGPLWCLVINALSFIPVAIYALVISPVKEPEVPHKSHDPWVAAYRSIRQKEKLRWLCVIATCSALIIGPLGQMWVPVSKSLGHNLVLHAGLLFGFMSLGTMLAPLVVRASRKDASKVRRGILGYQLAGLLLTIMAILALLLDGSVELLVIGSVLVFFFALASAAKTYIISTTLESTEAKDQAQDMSTYFLAVSIGIPIGALIWGLVLDAFGAEFTLIGFGVGLLILIGAIGFKVRKVWD